MTTSSVDRTNADQARAWDGDAGAYWAEHHEILEACLADYRPAFLEAAGVGPGDRVLDIGCGTGVITRALARAAAGGHALGVDLSSAMIDTARRLARHEGLTNVSFERADAQIHPFEAQGADLVVSHTGAMFFGDPHAAFVNLWRGLRPGGRLVLLTWGPVERQDWLRAFSEAITGRAAPASVAGGPGPFSLSEPDVIRGLLDRSGFAGVELAAVNESTTYGRTVDEAFAFLLGLLDWMMADHDAEQRAASTEALAKTLAAHRTDHGVRFDSSAWLVTARRP